MTSKAEIRERLLRVLQEDYPDASFDQSFEEIGMDSLDVVSLTADVQGEFDVDIPLGAEKAFKSPRDVEKWLVSVCG